MLHPDRVFRSWVEKEKQARQLGFDGLRVSGDTSWLGVLFQDERPMAWDHEIWSDLAQAYAQECDGQGAKAGLRKGLSAGLQKELSAGLQVELSAGLEVKENSTSIEKLDTSPLYTRPRILTLCTYHLNQCQASDLLEATAGHVLSLIRKGSNEAGPAALESLPGSGDIEWRLFSHNGFSGDDAAGKRSGNGELSYRALVDSSQTTFLCSAGTACT